MNNHSTPNEVIDLSQDAIDLSQETVGEFNATEIVGETVVLITPKEEEKDEANVVKEDHEVRV